LPALRAATHRRAEDWQPIPTSAIALSATLDSLGVGHRIAEYV